MGVKYGREYEDIITELVKALESLEGINEFFSMDDAEWTSLETDERMDCIKTLADDVIYALGDDKSFAVGKGHLVYDNEHHIIKVFDGPKVTIINLI